MLDKIISIKAQINALKIEQQSLEEEFLESQEEALRELDAKEYGCGTVNIKVDDKKVKIEVKKTVKWEQSVLASKFLELGDDAKKYIKCKLDVSEIDYKSWKDDIKKYFDDARTVTPSKPTLTIVEE